MSTSNTRNLDSSISLAGIIYASNLTSAKSEYSYDQYHCRPMAFKVTLGLLTSSKRYSNRKEGRAMKIKITAGRIVQIVSMFWCSSKNRLVSLLKKRVDIIYPTRVVIKIKISIA